MLLVLYPWHLFLTLPFFLASFLCLEILPSYGLFRSLLNQSEWHIFIVYRKIIPQHLKENRPLCMKQTWDSHGNGAINCREHVYTEIGGRTAEHQFVCFSTLSQDHRALRYKRKYPLCETGVFNIVFHCSSSAFSWGGSLFCFSL